MTGPLVLNLAPTGVVPTRAMSDRVPLQPREVVADVLRAAELGITVVHLHARDRDDRPTGSKEVYARMIAGIREHRPDLVLCVSCSGRGGTGLESRAEVLELEGDLRPDMASLTLSSLNFSREASVNEPGVVAELARRMLDRGIAPELEVFDLGMANVCRYLLDRGLLRAPLYANVLLGNLAGAQAELVDVGAVAARLPEGVVWSLAGLGAAQLRVAAVAAGMAHGVRIGLEDTLHLDPARRRLASNLELVERVHALAAAVGRPVMPPAALRTILGLG